MSSLIRSLLPPRENLAVWCVVLGTSAQCVYKYFILFDYVNMLSLFKKNVSLWLKVLQIYDFFIFGSFHIST